MQCTENEYTTVQANDSNIDIAIVEQKLAQAHEEIADLKLQIMWLERSYE